MRPLRICAYATAIVGSLGAGFVQLFGHAIPCGLNGGQPYPFSPRSEVVCYYATKSPWGWGVLATIFLLGVALLLASYGHE